MGTALSGKCPGMTIRLSGSEYVTFHEDSRLAVRFHNALKRRNAGPVTPASTLIKNRRNHVAQ